MNIKSTPTHTVKLYMAGDYDIARAELRKYCFYSPNCFNIYQTNYIYHCGEEIGFVVELINYPRFPKTLQEMIKIIQQLAETLRVVCCQSSYTITTDNETYFISYRKNAKNS